MAKKVIIGMVEKLVLIGLAKMFITDVFSDNSYV
jgi:hypothetical protein